MRSLIPAGAQAAQAVESAGVPHWQTYLFAFILVAMIVALALEEKIHARKSLITSVFAVVSLLLATALGLLPFAQTVIHLPHDFTIRLPVYIPAIDWEVIAIILGSSLFVDVTSRSGIFSWIAIKITKYSRGDPFWLLMSYGVLTVLFSAVLNNVAAMIIIGSLTGVSLRKLQRTDMLLGFLLVEALLTNVGGLLTLISSVPNIIVGNAAGISFGEFFVGAAPYVVIATPVTLIVGSWRFGVHRLTTPQQRQRARQEVSGFDENDGIPSPRFFWVCACAFILFIGALAGQSMIPLLAELGMGFVALSFAAFILIAYKHEVSRFYSDMDWDLLFFFMTLFVVINVMEHAQVLHMLGGGIALLIETGDRLGVSLLLAAAALVSSVTDNIPLAAMLARILDARPEEDTPRALWWAVVFGANLGGNITPIGSASTVVAMTVIHKYKLKLGFVGFIRLAIPFALLQIGLAVVYVLIRF